jgi:uncharacterized repeat protein (TIGR01451 family)
METFESASQPMITTNPTTWPLPTGVNGNQWNILDNGVGISSSWGLISQTGLTNSGLKAAFCATENIGAAATSEDYLTTPSFMVAAGATLKFFVRTDTPGDQGSQLKIKLNPSPLGTSLTTPSNYSITLAAYSELNLLSGFNYEEKTIDLTAYAGQQVSLAFVWETTQATAAISGDTIYLDDVRFTSNSCMPPSNLWISNTTPTSLTLNWTENGNSQQWEVYVSPCGAPAPLATTSGYLSLANQYFVSGLNPSTCYDFYVRSLCPFVPGGTVWVPFTPTMTSPSGACGTDIYDNGGMLGNYVNNSITIVTICPSNFGEQIGLVFSQFATEAGVDILTIYDGNSSDAPILGQFSGNALPPSVISTNPNGCLTIQFQSNGSINFGGYKATIVCASGKSIELNAFLDANNDGIQNTNESVFPYMDYQISQNAGTPQTLLFGANANAIYDNNSANTYTISGAVSPVYSNYFSYSGTGFASVQTASPATQLLFPVISTQAFSDVAVYINPYSLPRPGFSFMTLLTIVNNGLTPASGSVTFEKGAGVVGITVSYPGVTMTPQGFTYSFTNLGALTTLSIPVVMTMDVLPNVSLGQLITHQATLTLNPMDVITTNNATSLSQTVVGAYDPNFVVERHGPEIVYSTFGLNDRLQYTIHFQNEGNYFAEKVRIEDVLDSQLNAGSIQLLGSSHPCRLVGTGTQLEFIFDDIFLQPKSVDEAASQGFVTFSIQPNPGYQVGTQIPNSSAIYFDYNPPIYTNVFQTKFVNSLANTAFDSTDFVVYPNPTRDVVTLDFASQSGGMHTVEVYDYTGKLMYQNKLEGPQIQIAMHDYAPGMYFVRVINAQSSTVKKVVKW